MKALATMIVIAMLLIAAPAMATETGVTFNDDGTCTEADGTAGLGMMTGDCITPADYDLLFSYENLEATPSQISGSDQSIAAEAGIVDDTPSERPVGEGLIEEGWTFAERVQWWHDSGAQ